MIIGCKFLTAPRPLSVSVYIIPSTYLMPPLHRMAIFVPPVCDHKICQVVVGGSKEAEWLPRSFKGGTQEVQTSPWSP